MKNLVLVGFMGAGKTTVGKWAADRLGMTFVDMDEVIEQREGISIAEIFKRRGETAFRQLERELVKELSSKTDQVIAAGGGVVLDNANIQDFERNGTVICLGVDAKTAHQRTKGLATRPLLGEVNRLAQIRKLLKQRESVYAAIRHQVNTSDKGLEAVVDAVIKIYKQDGTVT